MDLPQPLFRLKPFQKMVGIKDIDTLYFSTMFASKPPAFKLCAPHLPLKVQAKTKIKVAGTIILKPSTRPSRNYLSVPIIYSVPQDEQRIIRSPIRIMLNSSDQ